MEVGLGPGDIVLDGYPAPPTPERGPTPPQFSANVYCGHTAGWIKMSLGTELGLGSGETVLDGNQGPPPTGARPPIFWPCPLWPNVRMD